MNISYLRKPTTVECGFRTGPTQTKMYQRTIGPENAHLKPDLRVLSHHEMTLTLNTHTPSNLY